MGRDIATLLAEMERNPTDVRFSDLCRVCEHFFGEPRIRGSHRFHKTPWAGEPLVNIQPNGNKAKPYQVRQVLRAVRKLKEGNNG